MSLLILFPLLMLCVCCGVLLCIAGVGNAFGEERGVGACLQRGSSSQQCLWHGLVHHSSTDRDTEVMTGFETGDLHLALALLIFYSGVLKPCFQTTSKTLK